MSDSKFSDDVWAEIAVLEAQYGDLVLWEVKGQLFAFKSPSKDVLKVYMPTAVALGQGQALDPTEPTLRFVANCLVYPDKAMFEKVSKAAPLGFQNVAGALMGLAQGASAEVKKP